MCNVQQNAAQHHADDTMHSIIIFECYIFNFI